MSHYRVTWHIDIEADTPEEAAQEARLIMNDLDPTIPDGATFFIVADMNGTRSVVDIYEPVD